MAGVTVILARRWRQLEAPSREGSWYSRKLRILSPG